MPDLDIIRIGVSGHFVPAFRLIRGAASGEEVLTAAKTGLAGSLRRGIGLPHLHERARLLVAVGGGGGSGGIRQAIDGSRDLLGGENGCRHAYVLDRAMRRMLAAGHDQMTEAEAAYQLARYAQHELLEHRLLACLRLEGPALDMTAEELDALSARLHRDLEPAIDNMARQLVVDPTAAELRTPPSSARPRPSARDILDRAV